MEKYDIDIYTYIFLWLIVSLGILSIICCLYF